LVYFVKIAAEVKSHFRKHRTILLQSGTASGNIVVLVALTACKRKIFIFLTVSDHVGLGFLRSKCIQ